MSSLKFFVGFIVVSLVGSSLTGIWTGLTVVDVVVECWIGNSVGHRDGEELAVNFIGDAKEGELDGLSDWEKYGESNGFNCGGIVGLKVGAFVSSEAKDGRELGLIKGCKDGWEDGVLEGSELGLKDGWEDGRVETVFSIIVCKSSYLNFRLSAFTLTSSSAPSTAACKTS